MTAPLEPALATAYVHELSADVKAVAVLAADGEVLAGPPHLAELATLLEHGAIRTDAGVAWVARTLERTLVAVAGPAAQIGPTALDAAAAIEAESIPAEVENPLPELRIAVARVIQAT